VFLATWSANVCPMLCEFRATMSINTQGTLYCGLLNCDNMCTSFSSLAQQTNSNPQRQQSYSLPLSVAKCLQTFRMHLSALHTLHIMYLLLLSPLPRTCLLRHHNDLICHLASHTLECCPHLLMLYCATEDFLHGYGQSLLVFVSHILLPLNSCTWSASVFCPGL
jgi:hypothetical protein